MPRSASSSSAPVAGLPVYRGPFGRAQAERLLWRAGFGPRPGQLEVLAERGLRGAVLSLTRPSGPATLSGPAPVDEKGRPIAPLDAWGHDHLWWLDRMVRSDQPLIERMTLIWHDWWATSRDGVEARWIMRQNRLLRQHALGSFRTLALELTRDPAMLLWLSGSANTKWNPNENYARELMELFTLGAGRGYTERDVREMARALTGWRNDWNENVGSVRFRYDPELHDDGVKKIFGRQGRFDWREAVELCLAHPRHPSFVVRKLWAAFVPSRLPAKDQALLERAYRRSPQIRPLVEAILMHPAFYAEQRMVKPPVVQTAGMLRALGRGIDREWWTWHADLSGQRLFLPPNVSGWDESRWLDTGTWRARWHAANDALELVELTDKEPYPHPLPESPEDAVTRALALWGDPTVSAATRQRLIAFAHECDQLADENWKRDSFPVLRQNALRVLVATCPDYLTC